MEVGIGISAPLPSLDAANEVDQAPPQEFQECVKDPLIELSPTGSQELWLIQWPMNQAPDFDGQELSLKLHHDGLLGSFEGLSGKSYDVVNFKAQDPDATVFLPSASGSKIVGKISRRVQLIHYPDPSELEKQNTNKHKQMYQKSSVTSLTNSSHHRATPSKSVGRNSSHSAGTSMYRGKSKSSSKSKSSMSEIGEQSEPPKKKHIKEPTVSRDQSTQDSGRGHSAVTSLGSVERSNETISKKKSKHE